MSENITKIVAPKSPEKRRVSIDEVVKRIDALESFVPLAEAQGQPTAGLKKTVDRLKKIKDILVKIR